MQTPILCPQLSDASGRYDRLLDVIEGLLCGELAIEWTWNGFGNDGSGLRIKVPDAHLRANSMPLTSPNPDPMFYELRSYAWCAWRCRYTTLRAIFGDNLFGRLNEQRCWLRPSLVFAFSQRCRCAGAAQTILLPLQARNTSLMASERPQDMVVGTRNARIGSAGLARRAFSSTDAWNSSPLCVWRSKVSPCCYTLRSAPSPLRTTVHLANTLGIQPYSAWSSTYTCRLHQ